MTPSEPVTCDIVLIGGGHAHVEVIRRFAMEPEPGVRLTIIARDTFTPYSGMLPGYLAGHYDHAACHIDLRPLARMARARLIHAPATGLDPGARTVAIEGRPPIPYDLASIDVGSVPTTLGIAGADDHAVPVKPVDKFLTRWQSVEARVSETTGPFRLTVVGGGAGGVEVALSLRHRLRRHLTERGGDPDRVAVTVVTDRDTVLHQHAIPVRRAMIRALGKRNITIVTGHRVVAFHDDRVVCDPHEEIASDAAVLVTHAAAHPWLASTGLDLDDSGFIKVGPTLQTVSQPAVFAAGDVAAFTSQPLAKSGVYAVRKGPVLAENLRLMARGMRPRPYRPQGRTLALISTGDQNAVASWGPLAVEGAWVWRWKDHIDRRWMAVYQDIEPMPEDPTDPMRCGGCGAKAPAPVLDRALQRLDVKADSALLAGLDAPDDAAVFTPPDGQVAVQTVDQFRALVDDPHLFGRLMAVHSLGDLHAMGATPAVALALVGLPFADPGRMESDLVQVLSGALEVLNAEGCALAGGHTSEAQEFTFGLSLTGFARPDALLTKGGLRPGDDLILTKPLGTGVLFAADMRGAAQSAWIEAALASMLQSSAAAATCLRAHGAKAATDVTGFGLAGHLGEMLRASSVDAELVLDGLPVLAGARDLLARGFASTLQPANQEAAASTVSDMTDAILFDPQTAGGLLAGIPSDRSAACLQDLNDAGYVSARVVGRVVGRGQGRITIKRGTSPAPT
ncbi:MAG: selenide, water dikinase SelD [Pseudomonadota bacterium]